MRWILLISLILRMPPAYGALSCWELFQTLEQSEALSFTTSTGKKLGDLLPKEIEEIQKRADSLGIDIFVVGSAAKGQRRGIGSNLPLSVFGGTKQNTRSDIDYAVRDGFDELASKSGLPDVDPSFGVRGVNYINLKNGPIILFSPGKKPMLIEGKGRLNLEK